MPSVLTKTEAGSAEIRDRAHALPRHARTLLVLVDGTRTAEQLLGMVQGSSAADLTMLLEAGLIAETGKAKAAVPAPAAAGAAAEAAPAAPTAAAAPVEAEGALGYRELYDSLNALSKEQLGLFKGYKFALEIEKASGVEELREVAYRLVEEVERVKGESAAQMVRRALMLKR